MIRRCFSCVVLLCCLLGVGTRLTFGQAGSVAFEFSEATGIGDQDGVCRRDPSDVIKVNGTFYVYYTKVVRNELPEMSRRLYPSGYPGTIWVATSNDEGKTWDEQGEVIGLGVRDAFDSFGVFTPNVLVLNGRCYLYYTAVRPTSGSKDETFENNSSTDTTAIGLAVANSPEGPFVRVKENPVLTTSSDTGKFDNFRIDDSCLVVRSGRVWLYYKGRGRSHGSTGPRHTQMGVATADRPEGPFTKEKNGTPVQDSGHEVQVWKSGEGVMSLVSSVGPNGRTLQYSKDGLSFDVIQKNLKNQPNAPGLFRPEFSDPDDTDARPTWGISMIYDDDPHLLRYEFIWKR